MHTLNKSKQYRRGNSELCVFYSKHPSDILPLQRQKCYHPLVYKCSAIVLEFMEIHIWA